MPKSKEHLNSDDDLSESEEVAQIENNFAFITNI